jgi:NAD+ synthase (glutamine-hydrolysing)
MDYNNRTKRGYGYLRVAAAVPRVNVADVDFNLKNILEMVDRAQEQHVDLLVFPELSITGYTCGDLFHNSKLLNEAEQAINRIAEATDNTNMAIVVGAPVKHGDELFNCAVFIHNGDIKGYVPKTYIPNYKEFYEKRWFRSGRPAPEDSIFGNNLIFDMGDAQVAVEVCEDLWVPISPSSHAALRGANVIVNLSASNELIGKHANLVRLIQQQSKSCIAAYVYASAGYGESSTDLVFGGNAIIAENGNLLCESDRFSREPQLEIMDIDIEALNNERRMSTSFIDCRDIASEPCELIDTMFDIYDSPELYSMEQHDLELLHPVKRLPFVPNDKDDLDSRCEEIVYIQAAGLMRRLEFTHISKLVVGISGGLDSTLALLVAVEAFDKLGWNRSDIYGITMPGFGTTDRTYHNALALMRSLGVTIKEISIVPAVEQHFKDIEHDSSNHDVTYENSQARERTQILMDYANKVNALVLGTGDLSELALGWATYNGDHMSMYNVNCSIPKTLVRHLVRWFATKAQSRGEETTSSTLLDVLDTPISPELTPAENGEIKQKTEDLVGPYELHDFFLYNMIRHNFGPKKIFLLAQQAFADDYDDETIKKWLTTFCRRFFNQQFKRSCSTDGPKVGSVSLSPRGDWRMPSDASSALWLKECEELNKPQPINNENKDKLPL